ncbi:unnamed protein product [Closterium sp. NIES-64]|nr:unnamed protein product [Closterium sp. NIES-64]
MGTVRSWATLTILVRSRFLTFPINPPPDTPPLPSPNIPLPLIRFSPHTRLGNYIGGFPQAARDPLLGNYIGGFPQAAMDPLLDLMFLPSGLNLNIVRFNIGGGSVPLYSPQLYTDSSMRWRAMPGYWPAQAAGFNWTADSRQQAVLLGAKARGVNVFEAFSNSPPWWMTASKDVAGGKKAFQTNLLRKHEGRFARYLVEVVERFRTDPALGNIEFDTLEPFNEALEGYWIKGMGQEGCNFNLPRVLSPSLRASSRGASNVTVRASGDDGGSGSGASSSTRRSAARRSRQYSSSVQEASGGRRGSASNAGFEIDTELIGIGAMLLAVGAGIWGVSRFLARGGIGSSGDSDEEEEGAGSKSSSFSAGDDKEKQRKWRQQSMAKVKELAQQLRSFRTVDLSGKSLGDEGFKYLAESLAFNNSVESVDFSNNGIGPEGVKALTEALATNAYLKTLNLSGNTIGDEGAKVLAGIMEQNRGVQTLQLSSNGIGDEGMRALAEMVKKNEAIVCLEMNNNGIEYEGCAALADALTSTKSLRSLHLNGNYAGTLGASALAKGLQENKSLRELHFNGNGVGDEGARVLASGLLAHKGKLVTIDLSNNSMGSKGAAHIAEVIKKSRSLQWLNLYMNDFGDKVGCGGYGG